MKYKLLILIITMITTISSLKAQQLDSVKIKFYEHQLYDVMEIIDTIILVSKLKQVVSNYEQNPTEINKVRLGIIYHETALNLTFLKKSKYKGYAIKSYELLTQLENNETTTTALLPYIASYRASALSLTGGETMKLKLVSDAFKLFEQAVKKYGNISYLPEFLRGSVAENLPWFFFSKIKFAKIDMQSIIDKQNKNNEYANWKIMSFTYWAWANQHQSKKDRNQALIYLDKAIVLDPDFKAGRAKAEELKVKLAK